MKIKPAPSVSLLCMFFLVLASPVLAQDGDVDLLSFDKVTAPRPVDAPPAEIRPEPVIAPKPVEAPASVNTEAETASEKRSTVVIAPAKAQPPVPAPVKKRASRPAVKKAQVVVAKKPEPAPVPEPAAEPKPEPVAKSPEAAPEMPVKADVKEPAHETAKAEPKPEADPEHKLEQKTEPVAQGPQAQDQQAPAPAPLQDMAAMKGPSFKLPATAAKPVEVMPPPTPSLTVAPAAVSAPAPERLAPASSLKIEVADEADLSGWYRVGRDGSVDMPLIGKIPAQGLTTEEFTKKLTEAYKDGYLVNPHITVTSVKVE